MINGEKLWGKQFLFLKLKYFWILAHYAKARAYITQAQKDTVDWENSGGVAVVVVVIELQPQSPIDFLD